MSKLNLSDDTILVKTEMVRIIDLRNSTPQNWRVWPFTKGLKEGSSCHCWKNRKHISRYKSIIFAE